MPVPFRSPDPVPTPTPVIVARVGVLHEVEEVKLLDVDRVVLAVPVTVATVVMVEVVVAVVVAVLRAVDVELSWTTEKPVKVP